MESLRHTLSLRLGHPDSERFSVTTVNTRDTRVCWGRGGPKARRVDLLPLLVVGVFVVSTHRFVVRHVPDGVRRGLFVLNLDFSEFTRSYSRVSVSTDIIVEVDKTPVIESSCNHCVDLILSGPDTGHSPRTKTLFSTTTDVSTRDSLDLESEIFHPCPPDVSPVPPRDDLCLGRPKGGTGPR